MYGQKACGATVMRTWPVKDLRDDLHDLYHANHAGFDSDGAYDRLTLALDELEGRRNADKKRLQARRELAA